MRENLELMNERGMSHVPSCSAGRAHAYLRRARLRQVYSGRVFYGKDAFEDFASSTDWANCAVVRKRTHFGARFPSARSFDASAESRRAPEGLPSRSPTSRTTIHLQPPFWQSRRKACRGEISEYLNLTALFRNQWGFRPRTAKRPGLQRRVSATLREQWRSPRRSRSSCPKWSGVTTRRVRRHDLIST